MTSSVGLFEIQLGIYAADGDIAAIVDGCKRALGERVPWQLRVVEGRLGTRPGGIPLSEFYDELPQQWSDEHLREEPGQRQVCEIRVGLLATRREMDNLREELTRVLCPEPDHSGPCPVPWSAGYSDDSDDFDRAYLNKEYGALRRA
jgi:hypothetical protein